ncbi:DUF4442 domain-containing protein [Chitinophaga pendula]|uniref:DUF4442 domain-containing protein n=1 Tax=Chitinophaga TaxID=79328 RepID=UPI000BB03723|nr:MULTISPECIES: DUF4442 domain-containing protein [Chitinophaga]ASZ10951.1 thioesterase [Chitinophaga sp. MD30]UCJ06060.1 DUF4442 domain-containing protein [Chitinophaga pendula]
MSTAISSANFSESRIERFLRMVSHPLKFSLFMFSKLPSAYIAGVRVRRVQRDGATTSVPYKWLSQNPFRSTYFACLAMAAELSTGLLAMLYIQSAPVQVSMLVTGLQASFHKKAVGRTYFTCDEGIAIRDAIATAIATQQAVSIVVNSHGKSEDGTLIASFAVTWSFKAKSKS